MKFHLAINLERIDDVCWFSCEEERDLAAAIEAYEAQSQ